MREFTFTFIIFAFMIYFTGCGSGIQTINIDLSSDINANGGNTVVIKIYQLTNDDKFRYADFKSLWRNAEETLAKHVIDSNFKKPIVGYIAGRAAPKEKRMGHAGAIVYGNYGSAESKVAMFNKANVPVAKRPAEVPILLAGKLETADA